MISTRLRLYLVVVIAVLLAVVLTVVAQDDEMSPPEMETVDAACGQLVDLSDLTIYDAKIVMTDQETFCKVQGVYGDVRYMVKLPVPEQWNGRFVMIGDGGHDGDIDMASGSNTVGYVVANSDLGHSASIEPGSSFAYNDRESEIDYAYRAVQNTTRAARRLIQAYYGQGPAYSYFDGCSTGGRQAAAAAMRQPNDFDGIIGGALFNNAIEIAMEQVWSSALFMRDEDGDGEGYDNLISQEDINALREAVLAQCDVLGNDKIADGIVDNPLACAQVFTKASIDELGVERNWTPGQIEAVKDVYRGPHDSSGENQWYKGKALGSEFAWGYHVIPTEAQFPAGNGMAPFQTGFSSTFVNHLLFEHDPGLPTANPLDPTLLPGPGEYRWLDFDFDNNTPNGATANPGTGPWTPTDGGAFMRAILNSSETDLTPFLVNSGGKYIIYHGWGDALIPPEPTLDYYLGIVDDTFEGNAELAQESVRAFMIPGMGHCQDEWGLGSASEFDKLAVLVDWVENGNPPDSIRVTKTGQDGTVVNERLICPWPLQPTYTGDPEGANDPANWTAENFACMPQE